jgi:diguanylate cyclase (GGDEF)-like protein
MPGQRFGHPLQGSRGTADHLGVSASALASTIRRQLPAGGALPTEEWHRRHKAMLILLWALIVAIPVYAVLFARYGIVHDAAHVAVLLPFAILAGVPRLGRQLRSLLCAGGLMAAAALMVHVSGGTIEAHFAFFVFIVLLTLYEDWLVFGVAVGFVLLHHGIMGMVDPSGVFNQPEQWHNPWKWAAIHALFVAAAGVAGIVAWRLNEDVRARMRESQKQLRIAARVDSLTGLSNRRALMEDLAAELERATEAHPLALTILDLNGFKTYNDTFGHMAGDAVLTRLGHRLEANVPTGACVYRMGGDEFCVLARDAPQPELVETRAAAALRDHGEAFTIDSAWGSSVVPRDASTAEGALRIADQRMYAQKRGGRPPASAQSKSVLVRAVTERHPHLGRHLSGVADLAHAVGRRLGIDGEELESVRHAAELHDVGKVAIPDAILNKPAPLEPEEWEFIKRHTIIGERILCEAPALAYVARLVRSSHERMDGTGYPDRLAGNEIPLGSRIVAVCDAYDAMVAERPFRAARTPEAAAQELDRCAGTQFDPAVVEAFVEVLPEVRRPTIAAA